MGATPPNPRPSRSRSSRATPSSGMGRRSTSTPFLRSRCRRPRGSWGSVADAVFAEVEALVAGRTVLAILELALPGAVAHVLAGADPGRPRIGVAPRDVRARADLARDSAPLARRRAGGVAADAVVADY